MNDFQGDLFGRVPLDDLFAEEEEPYPQYERDHTIVERFWQFHERNPDVLRQLVELTERARIRGYEHWSINAAFELIRWQRGPTESFDGLKLNNDFRALYSRLVMYHRPEYRGFYRVRRRRTP